jgi:hypothetical protein
MNDIECPYCGEDCDVCHDDGAGYAEDEIHQMECKHCGKAFCFETSVMFLYSPRKADCLNGEPHNYQETNTYPKRYTKLDCKMCGKIKDLPKNHPYLNQPKIRI